MRTLLAGVSKTTDYTERELSDAADLIELCLKWVPADRCTAYSAMQMDFL